MPTPSLYDQQAESCVPLSFLQRSHAGKWWIRQADSNAASIFPRKDETTLDPFEDVIFIPGTDGFLAAYASRIQESGPDPVQTVVNAVGNHANEKIQAIQHLLQGSATSLKESSRQTRIKGMELQTKLKADIQEKHATAVATVGKGGSANVPGS